MSYSIETFRQALTTICATNSVTFRAGYDVDINLVLGHDSSEKLCILSLSNAIEEINPVDVVGPFRIWYFESYYMDETRDEFKAKCEVYTAFSSLMRKFFPAYTVNYQLLYPRIFSNIGLYHDKDKFIGGYCDVRILFPNMNC